MVSLLNDLEAPPLRRAAATDLAAIHPKLPHPPSVNTLSPKIW